MTDPVDWTSVNVLGRKSPIGKVVRQWISAVGARTAFIRPGSPWENGFIESFHARLRDELRNVEIFHTLKEGLRFSSNPGAATTTPCVRTAAWDPDPQPRKRSFPLGHELVPARKTPKSPIT